ncbi:MAG: phosphoglycerate mutase, partial [Alistipes sp.]|nr:phosphoglycerate mutase [Alistipes sp.]
GKTAAALEALRHHDFVFLHIEASDEAGHEGDVALKMRTIEYLDRRVVKPILAEVAQWDEPVSIAILPDHPTPCAIRTHTNKPVPFVIYRTNGTADGVAQFDESSAREGSYGSLSGDEFMAEFIER